MIKRTLLAVLCALVFSICPLLYGQATGNFSGTVTDKTGGVIAGAAVTITSQATGVIRDAKTDDTGHYVVPVLPVSIYSIRVEAQGFQPAEQKDVRLQVDEHRELDFSLNPASVSTSVEVSATQVAVETANPSLGQVINSQQVAELPLNGRNFVQLATLTPGATQETNPNSFFNGGPSSEVSTRGSFSLSVGGSRASSTDWLYDGVDNNELTAGGIGVVPSIDAIQEFKVLTFNYSAQYGTRAGPTVLVTSKSGSNQFHGTAFEFFRNTSLDATSYFGSSTEKFNLNQFGGSVGGPIIKDKTFFFADYQGTRRRVGQTFFGGFVPTSNMRSGDFSDSNGDQIFSISPLYNPWTTQVDGTRDRFQCDGEGAPTAVNADGSQVPGEPCNKIPQALISPIGQQLINLYPLPNLSGNAGGNYTNQPVRSLDDDEFDARIDHNFSSHDSLFARFSYDQADSFIPGGSPGFADQNTFGSTQKIANHGRNVAISETHIFSSNSINQFTFGYNRIFNYIQSFGDGSCISDTIGIPGANINSQCPNAPPGESQSSKFCVSCGLTSNSVGGGYWDVGDRGFAPFQGGTNVFTIADSFDMIRGKHNIRFGGEYRANQMNVMTNAFQDGFWVYTNFWSLDSTNPFGAASGDNMADVLLGLPNLALHDQTFEGATTGRRWKIFRPYVQDEWRVRSNLTLSLGVAWAMVTPITEAQNRQANFNFATGEFAIPGVNSDGRAGIQMDWHALEPRIGLAWTPFGNSSTAIRAGYAIFHDSAWSQGAQGLWENPPFFAESAFSSFNPFASCPSQFAPGGGTSACFTNGVDVPLDNGLPTGRTQSDGFPILSQPTDPSQFAGNIFSQDPNFDQGMVQQYNLNVQHELPGDVVLTLGYAGSRSTHILVDGMNMNVNSPSACPGGSAPVPGYTLGCGRGPNVPYSQFQTISNITDNGSATYNSLQVKAETKTTKHGLYALLSYTWARGLDSGFADGVGTTTGATYWPLPGTEKADWALSQVQLNQSFTASVIYDLPFGKGKDYGANWNGATNAILGNWQINVIEKITSGFPVFVADSNNGSGVSFASSTIRPNQIADPLRAGIVAANSNAGCHFLVTDTANNGIAPVEVGVPGAWFNPCAFDNPPGGELGTANRTPLYGPGFVNTDLSLIKQFQLRERLGLQFRAEFFNLFNHPQFWVPASTLGSSGFGAITQTVNNPRLMQFALKLTF